MKTKTKIIIISILTIIVVALISYKLIGNVTMNNKIKIYLEIKKCSNNDIKNIKIEHSYLNKILAYDEWSILVEFKTEPNILYGFTYKNKEIIFRGVSDSQKSKDELKQLEDKFNDGSLCN